VDRRNCSLNRNLPWDYNVAPQHTSDWQPMLKFSCSSLSIKKQTDVILARQKQVEVTIAAPFAFARAGFRALAFPAKSGTILPRSGNSIRSFWMSPIASSACSPASSYRRFVNALDSTNTTLWDTRIACQWRLKLKRHRDSAETARQVACLGYSRKPMIALLPVDWLT
jgi:hypothetical protein